jgi:hypothetical protein
MQQQLSVFQVRSHGVQILVTMCPFIKLFEMLLQQQWLIDIESNPEEAKMTLDALHDQLAECQKKAAEFRNYQILFKVLS